MTRHDNNQRAAGPVETAEIAEPSPWVIRFVPLAQKSGEILDLACGGGRHSRLALDLGYRVVAADRNIQGLEDIQDNKSLEIIKTDLESTDPFAPDGPLHSRTFTGIIVTNYLHRPILPGLMGVLADDGVLIYETFAAGNELHGHPRNPDYLLRSGELLETAKNGVQNGLQVIAYEHGLVHDPRTAVVQRLCAVKTTSNLL
jgi:SAM-dependent methyltransferase